MSNMIVINGVRYRPEEAAARGLTVGRSKHGETKALSLTAAQVPVDELVEARVQQIETDLNQQHEQRTAELEEAFDQRVQTAVEAALVEATQSGGGGTKEPEESDKPSEPATTKKTARGVKPAASETK